MPTVEPYEVMMRRNGQTWALHARSLITLDDGTVVEGKPVPLAGLSDAAFAEIAELVSASKDSEIAALTAERDSLQSQLSSMTTERDTALSEKASLQTQLDSANATIETLQATNTELQTSVSTLTGERDTAVSELATANERIAELTAIVEQPVATLSQIRVWLIQNYGVGIIAQVNQMIEAIPNEVDRAIAYQQWEYANNVLRDNPFVLQISNALGLSTEQMDEAYLAATRIV